MVQFRYFHVIYVICYNLLGLPQSLDIQEHVHGFRNVQVSLILCKANRYKSSLKFER